MNKGDVLLLVDGRMLRIQSEPYEFEGRTWVQFIDEDEEVSVDLDDLYVSDRLGFSIGVLTTFYSARSIHLRLNRVAKV